MNPLEAAIRAACGHIGADPDCWQAFEGIGRAALAGLLAALPDDLAAALSNIVSPEPS